MVCSVLLAAAVALAAGDGGKRAVRMEADGATVLRSLAAPLPTTVDGHGDDHGLVVGLAPGVDPAPVLERLAAAGARVVALSLRPDGARLYLTLSAAASLAAEPALRSVDREIAWIVPWSVPVPFNDDSVWVGQSYDTVGRTTPIFDHGVTGTGEIVAVFDTGLDPDMCYYVLAPGEWNPAQEVVPPDVGVVDPSKKVIAYWVEPGATAYDGWNGHGTAVSSCVLADDWQTPSTMTDPGRDPGDGNAPNARLVVMDGGVGGALYGVVGDLLPFFEQSYAVGARIENHSWGSPGVNLYGAQAADMDGYTWRHEDMLFVNANGNFDTAPDDASVVDPAIAKNVLSVGATTRGFDLARDLAIFTSRGPTWDGRIKPDIVAPGQGVTSAEGSGIEGDDTCARRTHSGTSFAAPTAAGWATLARQYIGDGFLPTGARTVRDERVPSAAIVKATLIASAVPILGNDPKTAAPVDPPPSFNQGWGRPLLDDALYFAGDARRTTAVDVWNGAGLRTGDQVDLVVDVANGGEPFVAVLVWTDPPRRPGVAVALANDLDLVVTDPGGTDYLGNSWMDGESMAGGAADRLNNVEAVRISTPAAGSWTVRVTAHDVPGVPGLTGSARQGYALVVTYPECGALAGTPSAISAVDQPTAVRVSWDPLVGARSYVVERASGLAPAPKDFRTVTPAPVVATEWLDVDVDCQSDYSYRVRAWNGCSYGPSSAEVSTTYTGDSCSLEPRFSGISDARPTGECGAVTVEWPAAESRCPCSLGVVYSVWAESSLPIDPDVDVPVVDCVDATQATIALGASAGLTHFLVRAEDRLPAGTGRCGGLAEANLSTLASAPTSPTRVVTLTDHLETGIGAWDRRSLDGPIAFRSGDEPFAASPTRALIADDLATGSDSVAELVPEIVPTSDTFVGFRHTYELEGRFDGGVVELSLDGGASWLDAGPRIVQGRYGEWLMTGPDNLVLRPGYTAGALGAPQETLIWLGDLAGIPVRLRFRMLTDSSGNRERWAIDDLVAFDRDCGPLGALVAAFEHDAPACVAADVTFAAAMTYGGTAPYLFEWDFDDGSPVAGGAMVTHPYVAAGAYDVTLTVTDATLASDSIVMAIEVLDDVPAPDLGNVLRAVRVWAHVDLGWTLPPGDFAPVEVLLATDRDLSDLASWRSLGWTETSLLLADEIAASPALRLYQVRVGSTCSGTPGP